jgi:2-oxoglutarate ferredoxin oxidoreductase subunit alpha
MSATDTQSASPAPTVQTLERVVIRFAGDSGDGMQLTGTQFTSTTALAGNDLATLPDYPAEIRAPAGTLPGVSGFQIHFSSTDVYTPGDTPDVLVAMNPAALRVNLPDLRAGGILIVNSNSFQKKDLDKAGYAESPLEDHSLDGYRVIEVELTRLTRKAVETVGLDTRNSERCKNFFALGMTYCLFTRSMEPTIEWIRGKFAKQPDLCEANILALQAGYTFVEATEIFTETYHVPPAKVAPGRYRNISGNSALALGLVAAAQKSGLRLFLGSYPITPASDILHELSAYKNFGVVTFQAEDEIAAIGAALGASFAGALGCTTTSGPGMALKSETLGLAVMAELPLVICDIQRGGPSTGLPTKTEQADLLQAMFGRASEAPLPIIAASTPGDCFAVAYEAVRLAVKFMTPVIFLSDGYLGNGAEPWRLPSVDALAEIPVSHPTDPTGFHPYQRDENTLARPWAIPGTPGLEHRIGGLEKAEITGGVSYDPINHDRMVRLRAEKVARIAADVPAQQVLGDPEAKLAVVGWGSTFGAIAGGVRQARANGETVAHIHLRYLNPFPANLESLLKRFETILVPELNLGQLALLLRGRFLLPARSLTKVQGKPFTEGEILAAITTILEGRLPAERVLSNTNGHHATHAERNEG